MRRFAGHIFAFLCLLLVLTGCREVATYEDPKCHLTVTVRDQKNESVSGCSITVTAIGGDQGARTLVSGMDGEQYFDLAPGDYTVTAGKDEFFPADPVRVHLSDPEQRLTIVLNRRGEVVYNRVGSVTPEMLEALYKQADAETPAAP